jgi:predicted phosphodiesterase
MQEFHTLVMSDFHLGTRVCRADKILELLRKDGFDTLIINGDLFDSNTTKKMTKKHWEILATLEEIAKRHKVILVGGNHGRKLDMLAEDIGIELRDEYAFTIGKKRFLCIHGDEFDLFVKYLPFTSDMFGRLYYLVQKLSNKKQRTPVVAKMIMKRVLGVPRRQKRLALERGATSGANVVICSHTHIPHLETKDGILFINSGSFCDNPSSYITITKTGKAELKEI